MKYKTLSWTVAIVALLVTVTILVLISEQSEQKVVLNSYEQGIYNKINDARINAGLRPLKINKVLMESAQIKTDDMAKNSYFAHTSPDSKDFGTVIQGLGYYSYTVEENLAGFNVSTPWDVDTLMNAWMNSPEHKANILNASILNMGIGMSEGTYNGQYVEFVATHFGGEQVNVR